MKKLLLTLMACLAVVTANAWTVYFTNPSGWDSVYIYGFGGTVQSEQGINKWPGVSMTKVQDGINLWKYETSDTDPETIIFNNNGQGSQTVNLTKVNDAYYPTLYVVGSNVNGDSWASDKNAMTYNTNTNVYEWTGNTLGSGFKFNDGGWDSYNFNIGAAGKGNNDVITEDQAFSYTSASSSSDIVFSDTNSVFDKPTLILNTQNKTVTLSGEETTLPEIFGNYIYVVGITGWTLDEQNQTITLPKTSDKVYEGQVTLESSATFRFYTDVNNGYDAYTFGPKENDGDNLNVTFSDNSYNGTMVSGKGCWIISDPGVYNMKVDFNQMTVNFTYKDKAEMTVPDQLYVIGNLSGSEQLDGSQWSISSTYGTPVNKIINIKNITLNDSGDGKSYFSLTGTGSTNWDIINQNRYIPTSGQEITVGVETGFKKGSGGTDSWYVEPGTYDFLVDFENATLTLTKNTNTDTPTPEATWTVYYTNPANWEKVYIWAWSGEKDNEVNYTGGEWPGAVMTQARTVWSYTGKGTPEYVIFSNGEGSQTEDLTFENNKSYTDAPEAKGPTLAENPEGEWTVYFTNPQEWSSVNVYAWSETKNEVYGAYWPGVEMTYDADTKLWGYTGKGTPEYIIFNNNNNDEEKTGNLNFINGATYDMNGIVVNKLYLIGSPTDWNPTVGVEMTEIQDNIFEVKGIVFSENNYFCFTGRLADDESDDPWGIVNEYSYGASLSDMSFDTTGANSLKKGTYAWSIPAGIYDFYVNLNTNTVATTLAATEESPALALYLRGAAVNGEETWESAKAELSYDENAKLWIWAGKSLGTSFKIADALWTKEYNIGSNGNALVQGENYAYTLDGGNIEFPNKTDIIIEPVITLDLVNGTLLISGYVDEVEVSLTIAGTFNDWKADDEDYALEATENGYTATYEIPAAAAFKVVMNGSTWMGMYDLTLTSTSNVNAVVDNSGNFSLPTWKGGKITFTVNNSLDAITLYGVENVQEPSGDGDDTGSVNSLEQDGQEVIFNLQGVRVDRNKLTKGIYIINGKKVLVK